MNESHQQSKNSREALTIVCVGFLLIAFALVFGRYRASEPPVPHSPQAMVPLQTKAKRPRPPEEVAKPHLHRAELECDRIVEDHIKSIDNFFADRKSNTRGFADDALGWSSTWRLAADFVPFTTKDRHRMYIREKFEERIFKPTELEDAVKQVVKSYLAEVRSIEGKMLVDLRADTADFSSAYLVAELDDKRLQESYDSALNKTIEATRDKFQGDITSEIVSTIAGEVLTGVAIRLGVRAGILGAGAASATVTLGVGLVAALIIDWIVEWIWERDAKSKGQLSGEIEKKLDEMNRLVVDGSTDVQGLRNRLREFARERAVTRHKAVISILQPVPGEQE